MYLSKQRGHYYKYESIRINGKVQKRYYGRANNFDIIAYVWSKYNKQISAGILTFSLIFIIKKILKEIKNDE